MKPEELRELEKLFHAARALPESQRRRYVAEQCADRPAMQEALENLLSADTEATVPVDRPAVQPPSGSEAPLPAQIGPYRILRTLGAGGMGVVYEAEQSQPVRRHVALKLIKLGMDTGDVLARFDAERQALALMNHPNVAAVYDAGATEQGRPYFVMEYVPGEPITTYCDKHQLSLPDRLHLFMQVCHAVQHAHQKGIIHRDIKPSNVLVMVRDGKAVPKVIDFGVAKATSQRLTEKTIFTEQGQLIGTPAYMSPEQAEMTTLDIDTRTDVYSLGVLLYELLTGMLPFDPKSLRSAGFAAIQRIIREVEPSKPSTKLSNLGSEPPASAGADVRFGSGADECSTARAEARGSDERASGMDVAKRRHTDLKTLVRRLRGDLDWVTMKALEKDRTRRYDSASDFAADIQRHLSNEPVVAGPPSVSYRVSKFVRRNRGGVIVAALLGVVFLGGVAGTTWQAVVATRQRDRAVLAEQQQSRARQEADNARAEAQEQKREADAATQEAQWQSYVANIYAADAAVSRHDSATAKRRLAQAPKHLRNWEWGYLHAKADQSILTWRGHDENVYLLDFSPDGTRFVSVSDDHVIRIWDATTREEVAALRGHEKRVRSVTFSSDGLRLAAGFEDDTLTVWDITTKGELATAYGPEDHRMSATFSPDLTRIATSTYDFDSREGATRIWDTTTGRELATLLDAGWFLHMAFSQDGALLASADDFIMIWDAVTYKLLTKMRNVSEHRLGSVTFSPDGTRLASYSNGVRASGPSEIYERTVKIWDVASGERLATLPGHEKGVFSVAYSADGARIASGCGDHTIVLWDVAARKRLATLLGHEEPVTTVAFSPDGTRLATGSWDETIKVWDIAAAIQNAPLLFHEERVTAVAFSPDGTRLATGSWGETIKLWDVVTGEEIATLRGHERGVTSVAFSPDGMRLASGSWDKTIKLWDAVTGEEVATLRGHEEKVNSVAFSPGGERLASASDDKTLRLWDVVGGELLSTMQSGGEGNTVAFSPDGTRLASNSGEKDIKIWDAMTGKVVVVMTGHLGEVLSVAFSPDGKRLASGSNDDTIRLWDTATGREIAPLPGHEKWVHSVVFSPDGTRIASGAADNTVKIWDTATGEELVTLTGQDHGVHSVTFSPDGMRLATASRDEGVKLWDTASFAQRTRERTAYLQAQSLMNPVVDRLFAELVGPRAVIEAIHHDSSLSDVQRHAALNLILKRSALDLFRKDQREYLELLRQEAESAESAETPEAASIALNAYAWKLLTIEPADLRDPPGALPFALRGCELSDFEDPVIVDTVATAYHLMGDHAKAVETQRKAIALLAPDYSRRDEFEDHLAQFEAALEEARTAEEPGEG